MERKFLFLYSINVICVIGWMSTKSNLYSFFEVRLIRLLFLILQNEKNAL